MTNTTTTIYESAAQTAKRVRTILKAQFSTTKFQVRSKSYSGGSSVSVYWIDGPLTQSVESAVKGLESASFDGMIDLKTYCPPVLPQGDGSLAKVHGADFIFCTRTRSLERETEIKARIREHFVAECAEKILSGPDAYYWMNKTEEEMTAQVAS